MSLNSIYAQSFKIFQESREKRYSIPESIPITYFGDLRTYQKSEKRIITVGLNPSNQEFPDDNPYHRFSTPSYQDIIENRDFEVYQELLWNYYCDNPYMRWFNSFEHILNSFNASFLPNSEFPHRTLHTDICSPIPTNPTWNKLHKSEREELFRGGNRNWQNLITFLQPHLMLISVAKEHLKSILFEQVSDWKTIQTITHSTNGERRKNPYKIKGSQFKLSSTHIVTICFGQAMHTPFQGISNKEKQKIGQNEYFLI